MQSESDTPGALAGIRVLDLSRVLAGPWCTQVLADLGADVIKIERPGKGDDSRAWGPPFVTDRKGNATRESAFYWACNRGKRSVSLNLRSAAGREAVQRLAAVSDVVVENFKTGTLERLGLGYAQLAAINPRLIYCSITGFGQTGPYRQRPGYDTIIQALGGLMSVTGRRDDLPGGGPMKAGVAVTDLMTAMYSAVAILAAVNERGRSGRGQFIDMSLLDVQVASLANIAMNHLLSGEVPPRPGNRLPTIYPSDAFRCRDGDVMIIAGNDGQFERFCKAAGIADTVLDPRFSSNAVRVRNADALAAIISAALAGDTVQAWIARFEAAGVACAPINDMAQVFRDPQVVARKMVVEQQHPDAGAVPSMVSPIRLSRTPATHTRPPPRLGEHTVEVLSGVLELSADEIARILDENKSEEQHDVAN
jgi:crotonobetainyl-CoA:carnitine CoA-transferase CaiB-like acyl-CoA transferase